jgi:GNAT superfamily N-acetyltransferase
MTLPSATIPLMSGNDALQLRQIMRPHEISPELTHQLIDCWITVSNAGGAAGFPFPPVDVTHVAPVADQLVADLHPQRSRLILAVKEGTLAGWLNICRDLHPLVAHWGTVNHVQTHISVRGHGIGVALMHQARQVARDEMGLEQLRLAARGGLGLEDFYSRLGWKEIGRWSGALRFSPDDDRDEILMILAPL